MTNCSSHGTTTAPTNGLAACLLAVCCLLVAGSAQAQTVYKIIDSDGKITFTDKPTTTAAQNKSMSVLGSNPNENLNQLPYELRQAAGRYPVVLYSSKDCGPCDMARSMLKSRGIPFTERTVSTQADGEAFRRLSGGNNMPFVTIGGQKLKGYAESEWRSYLDAAGYPAQSMLPRSYVYPAASPLAPAAETEQATKGNTTDSKPAAASAPSQPASNPNNPAGIIF
ncbi:glutaredoxin family protein [Curvibacter sp. CHRR-16]|uniref:glutaredoxin family protein n=1 Tax=Curvibacter sp. CHRR-16 TaxID=2835872 RepID=UPI001BDA23FA|nr:glutaredoxin family protein [Curvibacter sp. CHRR-16]MBT0571041.1 glutaredoxin family protein [Curvibacter sp. CHRR-16]